MTGPIVFISRNRIAAGGRAEFEAAYREAVGAIAESKPGTALFAAYLDATGTQVAVVHAFPDDAAMAQHFVGSEQRTQSAAGLITPAGFEVYGPASPAAIDQLRRESAAAAVSLDLLLEPLGGFLRSVG